MITIIHGLGIDRSPGLFMTVQCQSMLNNHAQVNLQTLTIVRGASLRSSGQQTDATTIHTHIYDELHTHKESQIAVEMVAYYHDGDSV